MITNEEILILVDLLQNNELNEKQERLKNKLILMNDLFEIKTSANEKIRKVEAELSKLENNEETENKK